MTKVQTQKAQFQKLIEMLNDNPNVVRQGKCPRDEITQFWDNAVANLNKLGPPTKDHYGWRKVWMDYKHNIKKKVLENRQGGKNNCGVLKLHTFSDMEEAVIRIASLDSEGKRCKQQPLPFEKSHLGEMEETIDLFGLLQSDSDNGSDRDYEPPRKSQLRVKTPVLERIRSPERIENPLNTDNLDPREIFNADILQTPTEYQKATMKLYENIEEKLQEMAMDMRRMCKVQEKMYELEKERFAEEQRHRKVCEDLMVAKTEMKLRLLQIEEAKLLRLSSSSAHT